MWRTYVLPCAVVGLLGLAVGCEPKNAPSSITITAKDKDEAVKSADAKLKELDAKADELKAKLDKATGEEKTKLEAKWKASADKRAAAAKKLQDLKDSAKDGWQKVSEETQRAFEEMKKSLE